MNGRVAQRAGLILLSLIMESRCGRRARVRGKRMAFEAKQIHMRARQQARIRRAVRGMAGYAPFDLHGFMFVDKGSGLVAVTLEAARILRRSGSQLPVQEPAVWIMAIVALHQPFIHFVMKRPIELLFHFLMTAIAQLRSFFLHQVLILFRMMRRMAVDTADVIL